METEENQFDDDDEPIQTPIFEPVILSTKDIISQQNLERIESLEVLEEALTITKGISDPRIVWKESKLYNERLLTRIFNDDVQNNARRKLLHSESDMRSHLIRDNKYSQVKKRIERDFDRKRVILSNSPRFNAVIFCPYGQALFYQQVDKIFVAVFSNAILAVYDRRQDEPFEVRDFLAVAVPDLACVCLKSSAVSAPTDPAEGMMVLELFWVTHPTSESPMTASIIKVHLHKTHEPARKHIKLVERVQVVNVFDKELCSPPQKAVYCKSNNCIVTCHGSIVYLIAADNLEIRTKLDLAVALRLPVSPNDQADIHRITTIVVKGTQFYVSLWSGCLIQLQAGISANTLRPSLVQQYRALETLIATSARFRPDDDDSEHEPDTTEVKLSYAPTTISGIGLIGNDAILCGCGDGSVRLQTLAAGSAGDEGFYMNVGEYKEAGYLPACLCMAICKENNMLVTCDADTRLSIWNLSTRQLIGVSVMEGIRQPYEIHFNHSNDGVVIAANDIIATWTFANCPILEPSEDSGTLEPMNRSRVKP